jgi:hypothetical protein
MAAPKKHGLTPDPQKLTRLDVLAVFDFVAIGP